ncbi:MAG: hypothetical protein GX409_06180 [candidate division Zixibacteria bacterium]|nr:hypothetical protein [candidate division Zixibacteria bacterium]
MATSVRALFIELDSILGDFLNAYGKKRLKRFEASEQLSRLRQMTFGNSRDYWRLEDRFRALEDWFTQVGPRIPREVFDRQMVQEVSQCVEKISSYCRTDSHSEAAKTAWTEKSRAEKVASMASAYLQERSLALGYEYTPMGLKLIRPPEKAAKAENPIEIKDVDIKEKFRESLNYQREMLDYFHRPEDHLFTVVGYLLDTIEKTGDEYADHMAASILYFMKQRGYKVEPYVQRLKQLNRKAKSS